MQDLAGKVAFVTGGANGIGFGMVRAFLAEGMKVVIADWSEAYIEGARRALAGNNSVHIIRTNVADRENLGSAVEEALKVFGKIHILCNNAGVNGGGNVEDPDFEPWDKAMAVNLGGVVNGIKLIVPIIKAQGEGGHVVNTSSMAAVVPLPGLGAYSAAKYAVRGLSESLRMQLAPEGIGVSCLFPGATRTGMLYAPEDRPEMEIDEAGASEFQKAFWDAARAGIDPLDSGRMVVEAIKSNRYFIFTNGESLPEVQELNRAMEAAFPQGELPEGRVRFETMRAEMARNLLATGGPQVTKEQAARFEVNLSSSAAE